MRTYKIFISHKWSKSENHENLRDLLDGKQGIGFDYHEVEKDNPIHSTDETVIQEELKKRIGMSERLFLSLPTLLSVTLPGGILIGLYGK